MNINLLMRHAEKELVKNTFFGNEVGLTQNGINKSIEMGNKLKKQLNIIYTSPIHRCVETAQYIGKAAQCSIIKKSDLLGDPGIFITNTKEAEKYFFSYSPQEIVKHLLSGKPNPPGFCLSTQDTIVNLLNLLIQLSLTKPGISLFITHDIILATVIGSYFTFLWPDYLEAVSFWQENGKIKLCYEAHKATV